MEFRAGDRVNHYTLLEPLGEGGQGSVWRVVDPRDGGIERALKLVSLAATGAAGFSRAVREARILASAKHPALVTCHSFFEEPRDGVVGLLMDLVPGRSLADALATRGLDHGQALAVLAQVADALAYVHGENLVHRDLKPANLVLTEQFWGDPTRPGAVKLVDFGIAVGAGSTQLTRPGTVIGTLPYLAPELVDPATWGKTEGPPRDVFALGVLACQLLTHRHPTGLGFDAMIIDYARAYKAAEAGRITWPPPIVDASWGIAAATCLALRPAERPANGAAVLELLRSGAVSSRASRPVQPGLTSVHGAPRGEELTETSRPSSSVRTAPMAFAPPPSFKTIEQAPRLDALSGPAARPRSKGLWVALLLLGGAAGGAGVFRLLQGSSPEVPLIPLPTTTPPPPVSPAFVAPTPDRVNPCRRGTLNFDAGDTRFGCPVCKGEPGSLPSGAWQMRFHGVTPAVALPPDASRKICAQADIHGPIACVPFTSLPDGPGSAHRLPVTTADINGGGLYFSIQGKAGREAEGFAHRRGGTTSFLESALCSGFVLVFGTPAVTVTVFLDDG
jgi:serine/threonine-protein kinase